MINLYKTNKKLITNTYINLDYLKTSDRLKSFFLNEPFLTNIDNPLLFVNELIDYESTNKSGIRKDRYVNYGVLLTFMINNSKVKEHKLLSLSKEIVKAYELADYPYFCVVKKYKKSLYLSFYVCERKYYKSPKLIEIKAKQTRYKNNKGSYCKATDKGAKLTYKKGDIIRSYYSKFSSKTQRFRFASTKQFLYTMSKYKLLFIDLCIKCLNETVRRTITFKRCALKPLDYREKTIARIWTKSFEKMEKEFDNAYMSLTFGYIEDIDPDTKQKISSLYQNYNEIIVNNYQRKYDENVEFKQFHIGKKGKVSIDLSISPIQAKEDAKLIYMMFKENLVSIVKTFMYDKTILIN